MTFRKHCSLIAVAAVAAGVVAAAPASAATRASVVWRFTDATVSAGQTTSVHWQVKHAAAGQSVVLQRTYGTSGRYRTIATLARRTRSGTVAGQYATKAPGQGRYVYRVVVSAHSRTVTSKTAALYSFANVSMATFFQSGTDTVQIGGKLFRYAQRSTFGTYDAKFDATTCRSVSVQIGLPDDGRGSAFLQFVEERGDGGTVNVPGPGALYSGAVPVSTGALSLHGDSTDVNFYFNGSLSCWTPSGQ